MIQCTELWVDRSDFRNTKIVSEPVRELAEGEIIVAIDKFALTANNVSYAVSGDFIGYWKFYPAPDNWGKVTVWGCANVTESRSDDISVGERIYGFFPMSSHTILKPGKVRDDSFVDVAEHRKELPGTALYSTYRRTQSEPSVMQDFENERCLLFPLIATGYVLYDYLIDNDFFGAQQVVIGSASSKTGFGLSKLLHDDSNVCQRVVGITSDRNRSFVEALECCDQIVTYGNETEIDSSLPTAYVDMSGDTRLTQALHHHIKENMVESCMVGASHWEAGGKTGELPGAKPTFFFAPGQIAKREKDWGPGVLMMKAMEATMTIAGQIQNNIQIEWSSGAEAVDQSWQNLLDNKVPGSVGIMASLQSAPS